MAKKSTSPANDPASLAFSAVENALSGAAFDETAPVAAQSSPGEPGAAPRDISPSERLQAASKIASRTGSSANDDQFSGSKVLYGLQAKPSGAPVWLAFLASILWMIGIGAVAWLQHGQSLTSTEGLQSFATTTEFATLAAVLVLPVLGFFAVAVLFRRAQDLRLAATSMTQAAMRLAEPETTAADKVASVGQAVRREVNALGDGLERALSRAGELEVMVHNEVNALDRTYSENESRLRGLIKELTDQREAVITNADRVRETIADSHKGFLFDLDMISQRISGTIVESGGALTEGLSTAGDALTTSFDRERSAFLSLMDTRTTDLMTSLDDSAGRLNEALEGRTAELSSVVESRMAALTGELDTRALTLYDSIDDKTKKLADVLKDGGNSVLTELESRGYAVNGALEAIADRVLTRVASTTESAEATLDAMATRLDETVSGHVTTLESKLQSALIEIGGSIEESTDQTRAVLSGAGAETLKGFDDRLLEVTTSIDGRIQALDKVIGDKGERVTAALDGHNATFAARANLLEMALDEKSGHFSELIGERTRELTETIGAKGQMVSEALGRRAAAFTDSLEGNANTLAEALDSRTVQMNETMDRRTGQLSEVLDTRTGEMSQMMQARTGEVSEAIGMRTTELASAIESQGTIARDKIDTSLQNVTQAMEERATSVSELITSKVTEVNDNVGRNIDSAIARIGDAESGVTVRIDAAASTVSDSARQAADIIETGVNHARTAITDMVDKRLGTLPEAITARADVTADRLAELSQSMNASLTQSMDGLKKSADHIDETLSRRIVAASAAIVTDVEQSTARMDTAVHTALEQLRQSSGEAGAVIDQKTASIVTGIEKSTAHMDTTAQSTLEQIRQVTSQIGSVIDEKTAHITTGVERSAARMDTATQHSLEQIQQVSTEISSVVGEKAVTAVRTLGEHVAAINRTVTDKTDAFAALVDKKSVELENALRNHGNILRTELDQNVLEAESMVTNTTSRMVEDVASALSRLNESNSLLERVLDASSTNMARLESSVSDQTRAYAETVKDALGTTEEAGRMVTSHVGALQTTIQSIVVEFGKTLGSLEGETTSIAKAAETLVQAGDFSLSTLEDRRGAMEALASSFAARADEVDARMRNFAQQIADTVNETEHRLTGARRSMDEALSATGQTVSAALDANSQIVSETLASNRQAVSDTLDSTTRAVGQQLGEMSEAANSEGQRAQAALQLTQQNMLSEMQAALEEATRRFNGTAADMRKTATQVGSELEATRSELQRSVLELPEETRSSAAAMRRVVAEQIEALNELNNIVRSQPGAHDTTPHRAEARPPAPAREFTAKSAPRNPEPRNLTSHRPEPVAAALASAPAGDLRELIRAPAAMPGEEPVAPKEQSGGWLRDVLRNASASQKAGHQRPDNLKNLTGEIAHSVDDHALGEAWSRYQAGESNVFSRRIYTLTGQGTYDEVRKKLQRDTEFARTATAFMEEFEQLLRKTAHTPQGASETRAHLLSDRGKVYTMLAHASGRLQ